MPPESQSTRAACNGAVITGASAVARALKASGIKQVFALCGDQINSLFHAIHNAGIEIIGTRHESAAVQMADGWARATGTPGVALVTGGPGHTNAVTGAAVAQGAQSPVLIISGQAGKARRERGGNQSLHQASIMRPVAKWAIEAEDSDSLEELTLRALVVSRTGTPGAVSLSIPVDIAEGKAASPRATIAISEPGGTLTPSAAEVDRAATLLFGARKPVVVIGGNAYQHSPSNELIRAVRHLGIPVFTSGQARGVIPDDGDICFGFASPLFNSTFRICSEADAWLVIGACVDYNISTTVSPAASVVQIHRDPRQLGVGRTLACAIASDPVPALRSLADSVTHPPAAWAEWRRACQVQHRDKTAYWERLVSQSRPGNAVHPALLCAELARHIDCDVTIVVDVGDFVNWPKAYFPACGTGRYMDGGALGNLGGAIPLGIGAQFARPQRPVWVFTGDGGFGYHGWELSMAVQRGMPLKVIVGSDRAWGTERRLQRIKFGADIACDLPNVRYDHFAGLLGARGLHVSTSSKLREAVDEFIACEGPCVLDVEIMPLAGRPYANPIA